ncbi:MDR family MFS transporter [Fredinandcohnia humi]
MSMFISYWRAYHPMVHLMMTGTIFVSLTNSMSVVYLPIYLLSSTEMDPVMIGVIVGAGALTATIGGFLGGTLSDFLGRNRLLLTSLLLLSIVFLGFLYIKSPSLLIILNIFRGLFSSFFTTISKALVADFTPKEKRFRVFSHRYMAGNIGYSIGPILGTIFGIAGNNVAFISSSVMYLAYFILLVFFTRLYRNVANQEELEERVTISHAWSVFRKDRVLLLFIIGSILLTTVHGEMSVTLSQYVKANITEGIKLFGFLMSINGVTVIVTQVFITRWSERFGIFQRLVAGSVLFAVGEIGFALSTNWTGFVISMIIFTFGEILIIPSEYAQIDEITPVGMRGMYYGAQGFSEIGNFIGPWFGGILLVSFGGEIMFLTMALFSLLSIVFYAWGRKLNKKRKLVHTSFIVNG